MICMVHVGRYVVGVSLFSHHIRSGGQALVIRLGGQAPLYSEPSLRLSNKLGGYIFIWGGKILLYSSGSPGTHYVDQADLNSEKSA